MENTKTQKWNRQAVIGFILAIIFIPISLTLANLFLVQERTVYFLLILPLTAIALVIINAAASHQAKKNSEKGRGFAIAGIVISAIISFFGIVFFLMMVSILAG